MHTVLSFKAAADFPKYCERRIRRRSSYTIFEPSFSPGNPLRICRIREMELATYPCAVFACTNEKIRVNPSQSALRAPQARRKDPCVIFPSHPIYKKVISIRKMQFQLIWKDKGHTDFFAAPLKLR